jgi:hypothetical protein
MEALAVVLILVHYLSHDPRRVWAFQRRIKQSVKLLEQREEHDQRADSDNPEATANASMRRFSASPGEKTARFQGGRGWRYQDILPRARMRRPELRAAELVTSIRQSVQNGHFQ